jgi:hypothetical protein
MKSIREQIAGSCRHFNGVQNKVCSAGIAYESIRNGAGQRAAFARMPCFAGEGRLPCERRSFPTAEEVEAEVAASDRVIADMFKARAAIVAAKKDHGQIECPICRVADALRFSVSPYNGHVHAACATAGCVSWME